MIINHNVDSLFFLLIKSSAYFVNIDFVGNSSDFKSGCKTTFYSNFDVDVLSVIGTLLDRHCDINFTQNYKIHFFNIYLYNFMLQSLLAVAEHDCSIAIALKGYFQGIGYEIAVSKRSELNQRKRIEIVTDTAFYNINNDVADYAYFSGGFL